MRAVWDLVGCVLTMPRKAHSISSYKLGGPDGCQHAWARRYIDRERPVEPTWAQIDSGEVIPKGTERSRALGTATHAVLEHHEREKYGFPWPTDGDRSVKPEGSPDWESVPGRIAHAALPYLPELSDVVVLGVEGAIGRVIVPGAGKDGADAPVLYVHGVPFAGFVDLEWRVLATSRINIRDYKSTSNLKYALSAAELERDAQGAMYAIDAIERAMTRRAGHPMIETVSHGESVDLSWLYLRTRGNPAALEVRAVQTYGRALDIMGPVAERCKELDLITDSASAPKNPLACTNYGGKPGAIGCPYHPDLGGNCTVRRGFAAIIAARSLAERARRERVTPKSTPDPDPVHLPQEKEVMPISQATLDKVRARQQAAAHLPTPEEQSPPVSETADTERAEEQPATAEEQPATAEEQSPPVNEKPPETTAPAPTTPARTAPARGTRAATALAGSSLAARLAGHVEVIAGLEKQRAAIDAEIAKESAKVAALVAG